MHAHRAVLFVLCGYACGAFASEAPLVLDFAYGKPVRGRMAAWDGHIVSVRWHGNILLYSREDGRCGAIDKSGRLLWRSKIPGARQWALSDAEGIFAAVTRDGDAVFLKCGNGAYITSLSAAKIGELGRVRGGAGVHISFNSAGQCVLVCTNGTKYVVLTCSLNDIVAVNRQHIRGTPTMVLPIEGHRHLLSVLDSQGIYIQNIETRKTLWSVDTKSRPREVDSPFVSGMQSDGKTVVFALDDSWEKGALNVHSTVSSSHRQWSVPDKHLVFDTCFEKELIVTSGTSKGIVTWTLQGVAVGKINDCMLQRAGCIAFSADGKRVAVGSWDNSIRVFRNQIK